MHKREKVVSDKCEEQKPVQVAPRSRLAKKRSYITPRPKGKGSARSQAVKNVRHLFDEEYALPSSELTTFSVERFVKNYHPYKDPPRMGGNNPLNFGLDEFVKKYL